MKSDSGPIDVYLCPENGPDDDVGPEEGVLTPPSTQPLATIDIDNLFDMMPFEIKTSTGKADIKSNL